MTLLEKLDRNQEAFEKRMDEMLELLDRIEKNTQLAKERLL